MKRVLNRNTSRILLLSVAMFILIGSFHFEGIKVRVYPLLRELQYELILFRTKEFHIKETEHFIIRYEQEDEEVIDLVARAAEEKYLDMTKMFQYAPKGKINVIVYENPQLLMKNTNLKQGKPPMGVYYASTIQILSPRLWVDEEEDMEFLFLNQGPMVHEFAHLLVDDLTRGNYPLWFTEGMALYQEYVQTGYEWGKDLAYLGEPYTIEELTTNFHGLDEMLAYKRSFELIRGLAEREGFDGLQEVLKELNKGRELNEAHLKVFGRSVEELYE